VIRRFLLDLALDPWVAILAVAALLALYAALTDPP
jgi:hypothetical protein